MGGRNPAIDDYPASRGKATKCEADLISAASDERGIHLFQKSSFVAFCYSREVILLSKQNTEQYRVTFLHRL